jgi:hypothetical protein
LIFLAPEESEFAFGADIDICRGDGGNGLQAVIAGRLCGDRVMLEVDISRCSARLPLLLSKAETFLF